MIDDFGFLGMFANDPNYLCCSVKSHENNDRTGKNLVRSKATITQFCEEILPEGVEILRKQRMAKQPCLSHLGAGYLRLGFYKSFQKAKQKSEKSILLEVNNLGLVSALPLLGLETSNKSLHLLGPLTPHLKRNTVCIDDFMVCLFQSFLLPANLQLASL